MTLSPDRTKLAKVLTVAEADRAEPYDDLTGKPLRPGDTLRGYLTIGVGHNLTANGLSAKVRQMILIEDIDVACSATNLMLPWVVGLNEVRQRAFVELVFNLGSRILSFKQALAAAQQGHWDDCATGFEHSLWFTQVGPTRGRRLVYMLRAGLDPL